MIRLQLVAQAAFGAASEVQPKFTSHSCPASQWTAARKGLAFLSHSDNGLIDTDHGVILDVDLLRPVRQVELGSAKTTLRQVNAKFDLYPEPLIVDTTYSTGPLLGLPVESDGCPNDDACKIARAEDEDARQVARDGAKTKQYGISMKQRKKVEMLFAQLKRILGSGHLRLRGRCSANDEFLPVATAQSRCSLAKIFPVSQKPPKAWPEGRSRHSQSCTFCAGNSSSLTEPVAFRLRDIRPAIHHSRELPRQFRQRRCPRYQE